MDKKGKKAKSMEEVIDAKKLILNLRKSLSIFELGTNIKKYLHLNYEYLSKKQLKAYSDTYIFPDLEVSISTDEKTEELIYGIRTNRSCVYNGHELINMLYIDFIDLVNLPPDDTDNLYSCGPKINGRNYDVYSFDSLGLMLWVWRKRIRCINIYNYDEYLND